MQEMEVIRKAGKEVKVCKKEDSYEIFVLILPKYIIYFTQNLVAEGGGGCLKATLVFN